MSSSEDKLFEIITKGELVFTGPIWDTISHGGKILLLFLSEPLKNYGNFLKTAFMIN